MYKDSENANYNTNFNPCERTDSLSLSDAAENVNDLIERNPDASYLGEEPYRLHQLEFILMYTEEFSDDFIEQLAYCDPPLTLTTIDIMRCMALLIDEDFALQFWGREFTFTEVQEAVVEHFFNKIVPEYKTTEQLEEELEKSRTQFNTELDFLKREREDIKNLYDTWISDLEKRNNELLAINKESAEMDKKLAVSEKENEIQQLYLELEACKEERDQALEEVRKSQETYKETLRTLLISDSAADPESSSSEENEKSGQNQAISFLLEKEDGIPIRKKFSKHEEQKRSKLLVDAIADESRSKEQFDVIADAYKRGLSFKGLEKLQRIKTPLENFKIMEKIMVRNELGVEALKEE